MALTDAEVMFGAFARAKGDGGDYLLCLHHRQRSALVLNCDASGPPDAAAASVSRKTSISPAPKGKAPPTPMPPPKFKAAPSPPPPPGLVMQSDNIKLLPEVQCPIDHFGLASNL